MPFTSKYHIPESVLRAIIAGDRGVCEVAREYGCGHSAVRYHVDRIKGGHPTAPDRASMIDKGIGGDKAFAKLISASGLSFTNSPRAERKEPFVSMSRPSSHDFSLTGCALARV